MKTDKLGVYVVVRPRGDGTSRVHFEVPARHRPAQWPPTIPLPLAGKRTGDLTNAREVAAIKADALVLHRDLRDARYAGSQNVSGERRSFVELVRLWQNSTAYKDLSESMVRNYKYRTRRVLMWSEACGHPEISELTPAALEEFLAFFDDRPDLKHMLNSQLKVLLKVAVENRWIDHNPASAIKTHPPKLRRVTLWEQADVDFYSEACRDAGEPGLAALIQYQWITGQRLTDTRSLEHGREFVDDVMRFWQSKTGAYVNFPLIEDVGLLLESLKGTENEFIFRDTDSGEPFSENSLSMTFCAIRERVRRPEAPKLKLRTLRHSCVVQLARAGCEVPEIAAITGHAFVSVDRILKTYLPRDSIVAQNAMEKRRLYSERVKAGARTKSDEVRRPLASRKPTFINKKNS